MRKASAAEFNHPDAFILTNGSGAPRYAPIAGTDGGPALSAAETRALLVTRPDAEVRLFAIEPAAAAALGTAQEIAPIGNPIAHLAEQHPDGGAAIAALIEAGAFERV